MMPQPYRYVVLYQEDVRDAFEKLRRHVFESDQFFGQSPRPDTGRDAAVLRHRETHTQCRAAVRRPLELD